MASLNEMDLERRISVLESRSVGAGSGCVLTIGALGLFVFSALLPNPEGKGGLLWNMKQGAIGTVLTPLVLLDEAQDYAVETMDSWTPPEETEEKPGDG